MGLTQTIEVPVEGMDCAECTMHVRKALAALPGVASVEVYLSSEKAILQADPNQVGLDAIRTAVAGAGYSVPAGFIGANAGQTVGTQVNQAVQASGMAGGPEARTDPGAGAQAGDFTRRVLGLFGVVFGAVLFVAVVGEWLGLFEAISEQIPWYVGLAVVLAGGYPVFVNVIRAALRGQVISHTLMTVGVIAAIVVGEWVTAAVVVFFMRVGDYAEKFTAERARRAVKDLAAMAPQTARVDRDGQEAVVPVGAVQIGEIVIVRPGEQVPVDGEVVGGQATLNQAAITGESMPVEAGPGSRVYAATLAQLGALRVRTSAAGRDTTFGRVIRMVEEAEGRRADVQRIADRFSAWYLPVVSIVALLTFLIRRDPLATAAVLVVACSCSFALATPIAMLASIGAGAKRGLLIKGGKYLELLERAEVLLVDKTGTLTLGKPEIQAVVCASGVRDEDLLRLAASAERYSEHPLAEAVRAAARTKSIALAEPENFTAVPGQGVRARVEGRDIWVGVPRAGAAGAAGQAEDREISPVSAKLQGSAAPFEADSKALLDAAAPLEAESKALLDAAARMEAEGKTLLWVSCDGQPMGLLAAADRMRPEVPAALEGARRLGIRKIELLTGDNPSVAAELAGKLGVDYRAGLLPEDKIRVVQEYQAAGKRVIMVGDGVNDAPALAQADVGIAMAAAGSNIAVEAAHIALLRDDWLLVPQVIRIARKTMGVVKGNIAFTAIYNVVGLTLAALGILPPVMAAAAQSLPDIGILANSSRLIKQ